MRTSLHIVNAEARNAIPLLDASSLPDDDWALLESIQASVGTGDFEPDADRFGSFNVSAAYDE